MDETAKMESHLSSAAAFVEGGVQESCDDACSICLEAFCDSDPSTVTVCKHEFHLQCILEWCQRSSQCPMCWQPISLKDPTSQELLEAVERERSFRFNQSQNTTIFHHPALGDFELQHLPVGASDAELEERIIQHLAAAAAMGRTRHISRREGHRRSGAQGRPQVLVFSAHPSAPSVGPLSPSDQRGDNYLPLANTPVGPSIPLHSGREEVVRQVPHVSSSEVQVPSLPQVDGTSTDRPGHSNIRNFAGQSSPVNQDSGGPSDFHSFSESLKSRLNAVSMRCKESITKSTRGWKERFFSRNSSVAELGSEVRREVQAGIATVSRMMERLDTRENNRTGDPVVQSGEGHSGTEPRSPRIVVGLAEDTPNATNPSASCMATSGSN